MLFVAEDVIAGLNKRFMDKDGPTDVLSFPLDDDLVELGRWPDASSTGPVAGTRSPPRHTGTMNPIANGHSRSMATLYQKPRPRRGVLTSDHTRRAVATGALLGLVTSCTPS